MNPYGILAEITSFTRYFYTWKKIRNSIHDSKKLYYLFYIYIYFVRIDFMADIYKCSIKKKKKTYQITRISQTECIFFNSFYQADRRKEVVYA